MRKRDIVLFVVVIGMIVVGLNKLSHTNKQNQQDIMEEAISRAVIQCYAIEGFYPENIEYIEDHYGVQIDMNQYIIHYESIGPNIMPNIKVINKK